MTLFVVTKFPEFSIYRFAPTLKRCPGVELAIPTFDEVTNAVEAFSNRTVLEVAFPRSTTSARFEVSTTVKVAFATDSSLPSEPIVTTAILAE